MFAQLQAYKNLVFGGMVLLLLVGLYVYIYSLKVQISTLSTDLLKSKVALVNEKRQSELYKAILDKQTSEIEALRIDNGTALQKLEEWKSKPKEVKYKTLYKTIYKTKVVKSDDCKDIKYMVDSIRSIDFNSL